LPASFESATGKKASSKDGASFTTLEPSAMAVSKSPAYIEYMA
jgi:hypothetical protein